MAKYDESEQRRQRKPISTPNSTSNSILNSNLNPNPISDSINTPTDPINTHISNTNFTTSTDAELISRDAANSNAIWLVISFLSIFKVFLQSISHRELDVLPIFKEIKILIFLLFLNSLLPFCFYFVNRFKITVLNILFILSTSSFMFYLSSHKLNLFISKVFVNYFILVMAFKFYSFRTGKFTDFIRFVFSPAIVFDLDQMNKDRVDNTKNINNAANQFFKSLSLFVKGLLLTIVMFSILINISLPFADKVLKDFRSIAKQSIFEDLVNSILKFSSFKSFHTSFLKSFFILKPFFISSASLSVSILISFNLFFRINFYYFMEISNILTGLNVELYRDWSNSKNHLEFWRKWNIPMHLFIKKHVYLPFLDLGVGNRYSRLICSVFSGLFHDLIISLAFGKIRFWFLMAMILQIPLHHFTLFFRNNFRNIYESYGKYVFLTIFCVIGHTAMFMIFYIENN